MGGRQTHFHPEINVYETHSSAAGVKPRRDLDDSRRNEGGKERQEKRTKERRKKNQCEAEAGISFVMVTKCSAALTDGGAALYPPLYLRGPGADITEKYNVYVTVINEKRSEKTLGRFLSLSVYQSANSGKITQPVQLFVVCDFSRSNLNSYVSVTRWQRAKLQPQPNFCLPIDGVRCCATTLTV